MGLKSIAIVSKNKSKSRSTNNKISVLPPASNTNQKKSNRRSLGLDFGDEEIELSTSKYTQFEAESRLPFRSIPTQMNGMARARASHKGLTGIDLTKKNALKKMDETYAARDSEIAHIFAILIVHPCYRLTSVISVVIALFVYDLSRSLAESNFDAITEVLLIIVFVLLGMDLIFQSIVYKSYPGSFFFWLDLVGTITLLADISLTYQLFGYTQADLTVARGGRAGRAARTAASLRISRIVMWVRVTRLIRIARILRFIKTAADSVFKHRESIDVTLIQQQQTSILSRSSVTSDTVLKIAPSSAVVIKEEEESEEEEEEEEDQETKPKNATSFRKTHSSRIGVRVADSITRNVVFGILLTVCLVPIFSYIQEESFSSIYFVLDLFDTEYETNGIGSGTNLLMTTFLQILSDSDIGDAIHIEIDDNVLLHEFGHRLRETEVIKFSSQYSSITMNISDTVQIEHAMNIGFTMLIVFLFASLAFIISSNITKLVVRPIERMTRIVQEFTKNVCLLGGDMGDQQKIVTELLETEVIEAAITTLSNIFGAVTMASNNAMQRNSRSITIVDSDERSLSEQDPGLKDRACELRRNTNKNSSASKKTKKKDSFIAPLPAQSATTFFASRDSVLTVNVVEQKRVLIEDHEIFSQIRQLQISGDIDSFYVKKENIPEFSSLQSVMRHPIAQQYFRLFCVEHMLGEAFFFIQSVSEYHDTVRAAFTKVYDEHISTQARKKISILDKQSEKIYDKYETSDFGVRVFDGMRRDIIASLTAEAFVNFQQSKYSLAYVKSRHKLNKRYNHLMK